ncbi:mechanosensitive ion channel domain-containing protein [Natronorubrum halophilum]|uniref:mechanosensitive ion channel domain-containing protein n=1 Tax=Natronorubrum halophilum TaxID=1702106 RepID=UPI0023AB4921|nr:mechanosensitive ion channel domain-containing protein [Natronorubrum halophilum]
MQEAIGNLIGGVSLHFDDTYKTGDVVFLEVGQRGSVTDIGIRSTTALTRDNILITVPNAVLNSPLSLTSPLQSVASEFECQLPLHR